ncbi:MAG: ComEC/Rec2 family competence protein [Patescibacteria group bacterium]
MHKSQVLSYFLIAFLVGTLIGSFWHFGEQYFWIFIGLGTLFFGVSAYHRTFGQTVAGIKRRKVGFVIGFCIILATGGIYRFQQFDADHSRVTQFNDREAGGKGISVRVVGYVAGDVRERGLQSQFPFEVKEIIALKRTFSAGERVLVTADNRAGYRYGDILTIEGAPQAPKNSESFDYATYLKKQGIRSIFSSPDILAEGSISLGLWERSSVVVYRALQGLKSRFESALIGTIAEPEAAYIQGVLLGSRSAIPERLQDAFATTGTSHILAISGYNITIVAEAVLGVLLFWFRRRRAIWIATAAIILFTLLTGASASVVRAAVMGLLVLFASGYGRLYDAKNGIILAGALMVFFNPFILVFDIGFQLSFLAVIGLLYLYPIFQRWAQRAPSLTGLKEIALMTLSAQVMVILLLVGYFHSFSLVSLVVNILILPIVPAVMLFGFIAGISGMIWIPLGKIIGVVAWALARYQLWIVEHAASFSFASVSISLPWIIIVLAYVLLIGGIWWFYRHHGS